MAPNDTTAAGDLPTAAAIKDAMRQLDSSNSSVVSMMTGYSADELSELGGVPEN